MKPRIWRDGGEVRKRVADPVAARHLVAQTAALRAAGVLTPEARYDRADRAIVFPSIEGSIGLASIVAGGASALPALLFPLLALHRAEVPGLARFDPAAKIRPRLGSGDPARLHRDLALLLAALPEPIQASPVHGDFHAGQLIVGSTGEAWLVDLDDLAAGNPESDLGNFAAHLATRPETGCGAIPRGFEHWLDKTLDAYREIGGAVQADIARLHGRVALIRRALKLRERGELSVLDELCTGARWPVPD